MNNIQPGMTSPERETRSDSPKMRAPVNGKIERNTEMTMKLFHRYAPSLFAYLRQHTASREDAEDLLHEVFAAVLEQPDFDLLNASEQELWLWRVTRNKTVDTYRRKIRHPSLALDYAAKDLYAEDELSPESVLLRSEEYAGLLSALERLPTLQQEVLRLRFVNELPFAEVAKALGKREGTVRSILSRSLARLRTIYNNKREA
ncbi:MAG TPA: RNA polymerase sigma factor [Ktedonobacteraceae bacterium]